MKSHCWVVLVVTLRNGAQKSILLLYSLLQHIQIISMTQVRNCVIYITLRSSTSFLLGSMGCICIWLQDTSSNMKIGIRYNVYVLAMIMNTFFHFFFPFSCPPPCHKNIFVFNHITKAPKGIFITKTSKLEKYFIVTLKHLWCVCVCMYVCMSMCISLNNSSVSVCVGHATIKMLSFLTGDRVPPPSTWLLCH
jgi:hypothetical protein